MVIRCSFPLLGAVRWVVQPHASSRGSNLTAANPCNQRPFHTSHRHRLLDLLTQVNLLGGLKGGGGSEEQEGTNYRLRLLFQ